MARIEMRLSAFTIRESEIKCYCNNKGAEILKKIERKLESGALKDFEKLEH